MLFIFVLVMHGVSGAEKDETSVSVTEGDAVTLQTGLSKVLNDDTILWMFGPKDSLICQIRRKDELTPIFFTDDARFRGRLLVDQNTGSLTIRNTRKRHSGQYKLTISSEKTTTKIFNVTVFVVVGETDGMKSVSLSVLLGDHVTLSAHSEAHKDALMLWRFGNKGILLAKIDIETNETSLNDADEGFRDRLQVDQTGSLTIKNTRTTDSGLYELQIKGSEGSQRFLVSVSDPGLSSGGIAGIVGVVALVLLLLIGTFLTYYHRRISHLKKRIVEEKKETVTEGESVTLHAGLTETQRDITIQWCYESEDNLIAEISNGLRRTLPGADGRFRSKLKLDEKTGDLNISNIRTIHSGLYKLKISSSTIGTKYKRFIVSVNVESVPATAGGSVILQTNAEIQSGDLILWTFGAENLLVKVNLGMTSISERFRNRLELDDQTGSLTIRDITDTDSGHFKLQIINREQTTFRRFNVTVSDSDDSTGNQVNKSVTEVMPLLSVKVPNGANEQEETSSL